MNNYLFLLFILFRNTLLLYGIFLSLGLLMRTIIQTGMSKLMFQLVLSNEDLKKNVVLISNSSASIGSFLPTLIFSMVVVDLHSRSLWNSFFIIGWFTSLPILSSCFLMKEAIIPIPRGEVEYNQSSNPEESKKNYHSNQVIVILIFISNFLFWSLI